jgi:glycosyltransferase involved in cell wall biosynthesis
MKIAIDAHSLGTGSGGNEIYTENLINALSQIDKENEYTIYTNPDTILTLPANYKIIKIKTKNRWLRPLYLKYLIEKNSPDVYHSQYFLPLSCNRASIITIHDASFLTHPEWFTNREKFIFNFLNNSIKKSKKIIAVSGFLKSELLKFFDIEKYKIDVIYNGVSEIFKPDISDSLISKIKLKYSLPDNYILYVGRFNVRKNISILIKAFSFFKRRNKIDFKLVLVGKKDWKSQNLKKLVSKLNLSDKVKFIDYLPYSDLPAIYKNAKLFVFPSFYESFGLPPLEAMACGIPCITANTSAFPEITQDATLKINPNDAEELAAAIERLIFDQSLINSYIAKGLELTKQFTWAKTAKKTLDTYREAMS